MFQKTNVVDYKIYAEKNGKMSYVMNTTDVNLPEISYATESVNFSGMGGSVDMPNFFNIEAMTLDFGNTTDAQTTGILNAPGVKTIEIRWVGNVFNTNSVKLQNDEHRLVLKVVPTKYTMGKIERGSAMDTRNNFSVLYIKKILNGQEIFEIDVINGILIIDGVDYSKEKNSFLG